MTRIRFKDKRDARLFKRGESMWSPDMGKNWFRGEPPKGKPGAVATITHVDTLRGSITVDYT